MNLFLYISLCLVWGSTWLGMKLQLGKVPIIWSITYRVGLSCLIFFIICWLTKRNLRFSFRQHLAMAFMGSLLFSLNYFLMYSSSQYLISGLVAVVGASITIMTVFNSRLFLKNSVQLPVFVGSCIGLFGLITIFSSQFTGIHLEDGSKTLLGFAFCLGGAYVASLGSVMAARNQKENLPTLQMNAYGMMYGTLLLIIIAIFSGQKIAFEYSFTYIGSLLFLSLLGTVFAFQAYLILISRLGPEKVGYLFIVIPIFAMLLSSWFEGFHWSLKTVLGLILILIGNSLVLIYKKKIKPISLEESHQPVMPANSRHASEGWHPVKPS